jgi:hypothetical protein
LLLLLLKIPLSLRLHVSLSFDFFFLSASLFFIDGNFSLEAFLPVSLKSLKLLKSLIGLDKLSLAVILVGLLVQGARNTARAGLKVIVLAPYPHLDLIVGRMLLVHESKGIVGA